MPSLSSAEAAAVAAIDEGELAALITELVEIPSVGGSAAESEIQHFLARRMERLGLNVDLWQIDLESLEQDPDYPGAEVHRDEAWGLVAETAETPEATDGPSLILQGHTDVVPPGANAQWDGDPFCARTVGDTMWGRGTCDMKAGVAANIAAVSAIRASGAKLRGTLALHFVSGEEDGGFGAFATLRRGYRGDACIITEPTSETLTTANAGALTFSIRVPGKASHASMRYVGHSALDAYFPIHRALGELEQRRNSSADPLMDEYPIPYCLSVGNIRCGDWSSTVPDLLVAEGRMGVAIGEDVGSARRELEACVTEACANDPWLSENPATIQWSGGQFASGRLLPGARLRDVVQASHGAVNDGQQLRERGAPYGSDLRLYADAGIPTLHYGPGDVRVAHSPHENVKFSDVVTVARTLVVSAMRAVGEG